MPTISVDVDVDLDDFDTSDLVAELNRRGKEMGSRGVDCSELLDKIHASLCLDQLTNLPDLCRQLVYEATGRIV